MKIFCPGIRGEGNKQDQKRTLSYKEFIEIADDKCFAVIGRPIYEGNPLENIKKNYSLSKIMQVKICGLTKKEHVETCIENNANFCGFYIKL